MQDQATRLMAGVIFFVQELLNESIVDKRSCGMIGSRIFGRIRLELIVLL